MCEGVTEIESPQVSTAVREAEPQGDHTLPDSLFTRIPTEVVPSRPRNDGCRHELVSALSGQEGEAEHVAEHVGRYGVVAGEVGRGAH